MLLIIGRTASGKDTLARMLERQGFSQLKSYTTRPPRYENEATHIFITDEEYAKRKAQGGIPQNEIVAETEVNGAHYFATRQQVLDNDIYVIDPEGAVALMENMPDIPFIILYVECPSKLRKSRFIARQTNMAPIEADALFDERDASESPRFDEFERLLEISEETAPFPMNDLGTIRVDNDGGNADLEQSALDIAAAFRRSWQMYELLRKAVQVGALSEGDEPHTIIIPEQIIDDDGPRTASTFQLVAQMTFDPHSFSMLAGHIFSSPEYLAYGRPPAAYDI